MRPWRLAPLISLAACLVSAPAALAGTAYVTGSGQSKTLHYDAAANEPNNVSVKGDATSGQIQVREQPSGLEIVPVTAGNGCALDPSDDHAAVCNNQGIIAISVTLGDRDDKLYADANYPTTALGGEGSDIFTVLTEPAHLDGGPGSDGFYLEGATGADDIIGGLGDDKVDYSSRHDALSLSADDVANDGAAAEGDNVHSDVERISGGQGDDHITGSAGPNVLEGQNGEDTISGGAGDDNIVTYGYCVDADHLSGGPGDDVISAKAEADIDGGPDDDLIVPGLQCDGATVSGGDGDDELSLIDNFRNMQVSLDGIADDGGLGTGASNAGTDFEHLTGSGYDDVLSGGPGPQSLIGGDGYDIVDYSLRTAALSIDLDGSTADDGEYGEGDTVGDDVEGIWAGSGNDVLTGNAEDNVFDGGFGADQMTGGGGVDAVDYSLRTGGVTADAAGGAGNDGEAGEGDSIAEIEDIYGGDGPDVLTGGAGPNYLDGGGGADVLAIQDGASNDSAVCGAGDDSVTADPKDYTEADCETVAQAAATPPPSTTNQVRNPIGTPGVRTPTPPPAAAPADLKSPSLSLDPFVARLRAVLAKGQRIGVDCDEKCRGRLQLTLSVKQARRLGFKNAKSPLVLGSAAHVNADTDRFQLVIKIAKRYRSRLAKARRLTLTARLSATDAAGNLATRTKSFVVKR